MQLYEYNTLHNTHHLDVWGHQLLKDLDRFGKAGWKLVSQRDAPDGTLFIFMRPFSKSGDKSIDHIGETTCDKD